MRDATARHDRAPPRPARALRWEWAAWLAVMGAATAAMYAARPSLDKAHVAFAYLLIVLGASARAGRALGLSLSVVAFVSLNFFFIPPYHTLVVGDPLDWLVLVAFLATSAVAAQLLARAQGEADEARQRAEEVDVLSSAGAEALNAGRAEEALGALAEVIRSRLGIARCAIYLRGPDGVIGLAAESGGESGHPADLRPAATAPSSQPEGFSLPSGERLVAWVGAHGRAIAERANGSTHVGDADDSLLSLLATAGGRAMYLPLRVRERVVGVLRIEHDSAFTLDAAQRRFLEALSYYAALGVERVRLVAEAERAEALRQTDELKDALLASVSHDLRTPLTTIKALAEEIRRDGDDRAAIIEEEADRLNRFVADLLDLSRLAGGALRVTADVNAAEDLIGTALQRVAGAARGRDIVVRMDPADPLLLGRFDFVHALRVLVNLLENALKYSPAGAPVEVGAERVGEALEIRVADRGPGVAPEDRERIFEPFYRPAGTAPDVGGTGLGLSIARRLAAAQGGRVDYEARDGGGSVFVLRLPAADLGELEERPAT